MDWRQYPMENVLTHAVIAKHYKKDMTPDEEAKFADAYNAARLTDLDACDTMVRLAVDMVEKRLRLPIDEELQDILQRRLASLKAGNTRHCIFTVMPYLKDLCEYKEAPCVTV